MTKPFWESKVFWINVVAAVVIVLEATGVIDVAPDAARVDEWAAIILALVNIVLRFVTRVQVTVRRV